MKIATLVVLLFVGDKSRLEISWECFVRMKTLRFQTRVLPVQTSWSTMRRQRLRSADNFDTPAGKLYEMGLIVGLQRQCKFRENDNQALKADSTSAP